MTDEAGPQERRRPRRRRIWLAGLLGSFVMAGAFLGVHAISSSAGGDFHIVRLRARAPAFDLADLRDPRSRVQLSRFAGAPLVVNFWASWCVPCRTEMKAFESETRRLSGRVTIIGIDTDDDRAAALSFAKKVGATYRLAFDSDGATASRSGVFGLPSTLFINAKGMMLERRLGAMTRGELERTIEKLLRP